MTTRRLPPLAEHAFGLLALVLAWQIYVSTADVPNFLLPPPEAVGRSVVGLAETGDLWRHLGFTLGNVVMGFILGALLGVAAGIGLAACPTTERWLEGPILILQTAPKIALAPLFVIWFGLGIASKLALIVSLVVFPVLVGTLVGLRSLDPRFVDLGRVLGLTKIQQLTRIALPAALPEIFIGLRIGAVQAVVGAILGEWMSGRLGLGHLMTFATATYRTSLLFAAVLLTVLVGILVHLLVEGAERRLLRWKP